MLNSLMIESLSNSILAGEVVFLVVIILVPSLLIVALLVGYSFYRDKKKEESEKSQQSLQNQTLPIPAPTENLSQEQVGGNHTFLKIIIKLFIIAILVFLALWNYRFFTFDGGFSKRDFDDKSFTKVIYEFTGIEKIEYYKRTIPNDNLPYIVFISTRGENYLCGATENDIKYLNITGSLSELLGISSMNIKPKEITIVPFYVEIIAGFIVLIIPFGRRQQGSSNKTD